MRILIINLARAKDRRQRMQRQLASYGLDCEFLEATDGRFLTAEERSLVDNERRRSVSSCHLSDNEIGCDISHRRAMHNLISSNAPMAVILEDDVDLTPEFPLVLAALEKEQPEFDFIFLGRKFKKRERFIPCSSILPGLKLGRVGYTHMGAIGYVVSQKGARRFLSYAPRIVHAVDKEIHRFWANGLDLYGLERPVIIHLDDGLSYLNETRHEDQPALRVRYDDADTFYWRVRRQFTKALDSIQKRLSFPRYVEKALARYSHQNDLKPPVFNPFAESIVRIIRGWPANLRGCIERLYVFCCVAKDRRIPFYYRLPAILGVGYFFNPIQLIPDNVPVIGYWDNVGMVALGVWISLRLVPPDVTFQYRKLAQRVFETCA